MKRTVTLAVEIDTEQDDHVMLVAIVDAKKSLVISTAGPEPEPTRFGPIAQRYMASGRVVTASWSG